MNKRDHMVQQTTLEDFGPFVESLLFGAERLNLTSLDDVAARAWDHPGRRELETLLGHQFQRPRLLLIALTHRSIVSEIKHLELKSYERMEFLGDALLDLLVSERLMKDFKKLSEGELSKFRSTLVNEETLGEIGSHFHLERFLIVGRGERLAYGHRRQSAKADVLESLFAAIYLDGGSEDLGTVREVFDRLIRTFEKSGPKFYDQSRLSEFDPKTKLQEKTMQRLGILPQYEASEKEDGFQVDVTVAGEIISRSFGPSKKRASKEAAKLALHVIDQIIDDIYQRKNSSDGE